MNSTMATEADPYSDAKSLFTSRTFWFNVLYGAAAILGSPQVTGIIPPADMPYVVAGAAVINIFLRLVTSEPVKLP